MSVHMYNMYLYTPYNIYICIICVNMWNMGYEGYPMAGLGVVMASWWRCGTWYTAYNTHTHIYTWYMGCVAMYYVYVTTCITAVNIAHILDTPEISWFWTPKMDPRFDPLQMDPQIQAPEYPYFDPLSGYPIIPLFPIRARAYNDLYPISGVPQNQHQIGGPVERVFNSTRIRIQKGVHF